MNNNRPKIGTGVIIRYKNKVLMGLRNGPNGPGFWSPPGGHMEFGESLEECVRRETMEESGISIINIKKGPYTSDINIEKKLHYITLWAVADLESGEPKLMEPDRFDKWEWFSWDNLPEPLFPPVTHLIQQHFNPFNV